MTDTEEKKELAEVQISSKDIFEGKILHLVNDEVRLPNGETSGREVISHIGAVCIIPIP